MNRALPASVFVHLIFLLIVVMFGAWVDRPTISPRRNIAVQMVTLPETQPEEPVETEEAVDPEPEPEPPAPVEPTPVEPEPEVVPEIVPPEPDDPAPDPEPEPQQVREPERPVDPPAEPVELGDDAEDVPVEAAPDVSSVSGTDQEIPPQFQYYLTILQGKVSRQWQPKRLGMRTGSERWCAVHFFVERDGRITRETLVQGSGVSLFDKEALGAVRRAGRMPPLPAGIKGASLGVTFTFTLKTGT